MTVLSTLPPPAAEPHARRLTVADHAALPTQLPSGPVQYELDNGRLVVMPPPGDTRGAVESKFTAHLYFQGEIPKHGKTRCGEVFVILWRDPDRVVGADAVFIANRSLPIRVSKEDYLETIPDLVVEVRSKNDTGPEVEAKVRDYLKAGVRLVWVADPAKRTVTAHRPGHEPQTYTEADTLTADDIIPGFRMAVSEAFQA